MVCVLLVGISIYKEDMHQNNIGAEIVSSRKHYISYLSYMIALILRAPACGENLNELKARKKTSF